MIEVSANPAPALALPGAVLPAAPAAASGQGAPAADFSVVLSGATLSTAAPLPAQVAAAVAEAARTLPVAPAPTQPLPVGEPGMPGSETGKILPAGKLPANRQLAVAERPARKSMDDVRGTGQEPGFPSGDAPVPAPTAEVANAASATPVPPTAQTLMSQDQRSILAPAAPALAASRVVSPRIVSTAPTASAPADKAQSLATPVREAIAASPSSVADAPAPRSEESAAAARAIQSQPGMVSQFLGALEQSAALIAVPAAAAGAEANVVPDTLSQQPATSALAFMQLPRQPAATAATKAGAVSVAAALAPVLPASAQVLQPDPAQAAPGTASSPDSNTLPTSNTASLVVAAAVEHKSTHPASSPTPAMPEVSAPAPRAEAFAAPAELRAVPTALATTPAPVTAASTQDISALVDRITEARAAAAPHAVRASLVHQDFGSVSVNFRAEDSHIHVTLGSADPGFAPAVHAAAAASLAGSDADRRDAQSQAQPQSQHHGQQPNQQTAAQDGGTSHNPASQQQAHRERTAGNERNLARDPGTGRGSATAHDTPSDPASTRRSGIYA